MGQIGIPTINKTGYSMFWNSMWDNKIMYNRLLKEDVFLNQFFNLLFVDKISLNIFNIDKKYIKKSIKIYKPQILHKKINLKKYFYNKKQTNSYSSKVWILRYQKWIIFYQFFYLSCFNTKIQKKKEFNDIFNYNSNFYYLLNYYNKVNSSLKLSFNFYKKKNNDFLF